MFFSTYWTWLQTQLDSYVGTNTALISAAIEPAAVTLAAIYVMLWGYLMTTGRIQEPVMDGFKRIMLIVILFGLGLRLWSYNTLIVDTVINGPRQLAARIVGAADPIATVDRIWDRGGSVASELWNKGGIFEGDVGFYLAGAFVYLMIGAVAVYAMFLLALSQIALSILLVLGPLFIVLLLFETTKRFFESWVAALANYALITPLSILVSVFLLQIVESYAEQTAARGAAILTVDALNMVLVAGLSLLVLRQVPAMASQLASGIALSSFHAVSSLVSWGLGGAKRSTYELGRGVLDGMRGDPFIRYDSLRRVAGNLVGSGIAAGYRRATEGQTRGGTLVPREEVMPKRKLDF